MVRILNCGLKTAHKIYVLWSKMSGFVMVRLITRSFENWTISVSEKPNVLISDVWYSDGY